MNPNYSVYRIHKKMALLEKLYDLDKFAEGEKNSPEQIRKYYSRLNNWAYRRFHSHDGFMHFRISKNGCFGEEDAYYQPDSVSEFIKPGSVVIELGFGQGPNLLYLARCHPDARFIGVDLQILKDKDIPDNVTTYTLDYNDLSRFEDSSADVFFAFETIVHNSDKEKIYNQVYRILKPGGVFIVYDYSLRWKFETYDPVLQRAIKIFKGPSCAIIESADDMCAHFTNCGFQVEATDLTRETLPDLRRLERKAAKVIERTWLAKIMSWLLPDLFNVNIIIGYLGYDGANSGFGNYTRWIAKK